MFKVYFIRGDSFEVESDTEGHALRKVIKENPQCASWDVLKIEQVFDIDEHDAQMAAEMYAVASMMKIAMREGLETEVIHWYGQFRADGEDVIGACYHALGEWIK